MNYFIYMHAWIIFFLSILFTVVCLFTIMAIALWLIKPFKLPENISKALIAVMAFIVLFSSLIGFSKALDPFNQGGIKEIFLVNSNKLSVWLTRIHSKRVGADYDQRLKTFDLETGKPLGMVEMSKRHWSSEYYLYRFSKNRAWAHSRKTGAQLLDLAKPSIIKTAKKIPRRASLAKVYPRGWSFKAVAGSLGKYLVAQGGRPSAKSAILLKPKLIEELNKNATLKNKVWVAHQSAIYGKYDPILSYVNVNGKELSRINLNKVFEGKKKTKAIATFSKNNEILIFVSSGDTFRATILGFTLVALRTDPATGKIRGRIDYVL